MNVLSINDTEISLDQLIRKIKAGGRTAILQPLVHQIVIEEYTVQRNISASIEELQEAFDNFRKSRGLYTSEDTERWIDKNGTTLDEIEKELEIKILTEKIKAAVPKEAVEKFFAENKTNLDAVELSILTVSDKEVAMELLAQLNEEEADFMILARDHSIDNRAKQGGYAGIAKRCELRNDVAASVFGAEQGEVAGPFEAENGYNLIKVSAVFPAILDEVMDKKIRNILFEYELADAELKAKIEWGV